jgi:predicted glycosyltransferase
MVHPDELTPERMADELAAMLRRPRPRYEPAEHCGATVAAAILARLAAEPAAARALAAVAC